MPKAEGESLSREEEDRLIHHHLSATGRGVERVWTVNSGIHVVWVAETASKVKKGENVVSKVANAHHIREEEAQAALIYAGRYAAVFEARLLLNREYNGYRVDPAKLSQARQTIKANSTAIDPLLEIDPSFH